MSRHDDYDRERWMRQAARMCDRGYATSEIAETLGVSGVTVRKWLRVLRPGCIERDQVRHLRAARAAGFATVQEAVAALAEGGATYLEIQARLGMSNPTVARYLRRERARRPVQMRQQRGGRPLRRTNDE